MASIDNEEEGEFGNIDFIKPGKVNVVSVKFE